MSREDARRVIAYGPNSGVQPFDGNTEFEIGSSDSNCLSDGMVSELVLHRYGEYVPKKRSE